MRISDWSSDVCSSDLSNHAGSIAVKPFSLIPVVLVGAMSPAPIAAASIQQAPQLDIVLKPTRIDPAAGTGEVDVGMTITGVSAAQGAVLLAHQPGGPRMTRPIGIADMLVADEAGDRKSTRLNSSH